MDFKINQKRLLDKIECLAKIGAIDNNGVSRLALTKEDKIARDLVVQWMKELDLNVNIDQLGNIIAIRKGLNDNEPVMTGSHIDTVSTAGKLDGCYGVLAGLEIVNTLNENNIQTKRPIAVGVFTNEEGVRYTPDMMGSLAYVGELSLKKALETKGFDGSILGEELEKINYAGDLKVGAIKPHSYVELHIEQGPILSQEKIKIGVVENLLGISWQEITIIGEANHAGTTPLDLRHDAGLVVAKIISFVRELCLEVGGEQRGTCGMIEFEPNIINVIPSSAKFTIDLRNSCNDKLIYAENTLSKYIDEISQEEGVKIQKKQLVRFEPVEFNKSIVETIQYAADKCGYTYRLMTSGAGHDAQMMSRICPSAMIFVPSKDGISHNPREYSSPNDLGKGVNVLYKTMIQLANH